MVEFRTEELMKKAVEKVNKHIMNGRPLKVKEVILISSFCFYLFIMTLSDVG